MSYNFGKCEKCGGKMRRKKEARKLLNGKKVSWVYWLCKKCGWRLTMYKSPDWEDEEPDINETDFYAPKKKAVEEIITQVADVFSELSTLPTPKFCTQCGKELEGDETFCGGCGSPVEK